MRVYQQKTWTDQVVFSTNIYRQISPSNKTEQTHTLDKVIPLDG